MGGAFWLFNMAYTQVSIFVVLFITRSQDVVVVEGDNIAPGDERALTPNDVLLIAIICSGCWLISVVLLIIFSEEGFGHINYATWTSREFLKLRFNLGDDREGWSF